MNIRQYMAVSDSLFTLPTRESFAGSSNFNVAEVDACVGPKVDHVVQGNPSRGLPSQFSGRSAKVFDAPEGHPSSRIVGAGTTFLVSRIQNGFLLLRGTSLSGPGIPPGHTIGWVRAADVVGFHPRNCV